MDKLILKVFPFLKNAISDFSQKEASSFAFLKT